MTKLLKYLFPLSLLAACSVYEMPETSNLPIGEYCHMKCWDAWGGPLVDLVVQSKQTDCWCSRNECYAGENTKSNGDCLLNWFVVLPEPVSQ